MLYGLKLNKEELFIVKKKGLVLLHFIWPKSLKKIWNGNICLLKRKGEGGYISRQILLKNSKANCWWSLSLSSLLHADSWLTLIFFNKQCLALVYNMCNTHKMWEYVWHVSLHSVSILLSKAAHCKCACSMVYYVISDSTRGKRVTFGSMFDESRDWDKLCEVEPRDDSSACIYF